MRQDGCECGFWTIVSSQCVWDRLEVFLVSSPVFSSSLASGASDERKPSFEHLFGSRRPKEFSSCFLVESLEIGDLLFTLTIH